MASTAAASVQDPSQLLTSESAGSVVEGSLVVAGSQRAEGGYTVYRILFKVWDLYCEYSVRVSVHLFVSAGAGAESRRSPCTSRGEAAVCVCVCVCVCV